MTPAARVQAAIEILDDHLSGRSAEQALTHWGRTHRFAGSKDRAALRDLVFDALRCRASYAWLGGGLTGRGLMLGALRAGETPLASFFNGQGHAPEPVTATEERAFAEPSAMPAHVAADMPAWLLPLMQETFGARTVRICEALRYRAPVDLRVNTLKTDVEKARTALAAEGILAEPLTGVATALRVTEGSRKLVRSEAYAQGHVELQDAASQLSVLQAPLPPRGEILDFCAGGGGKTLALATRSGGAVHVHDAAPQRMRDLPGRARRAGVSVHAWEPAHGGSFALVFCDAPCSGSGTWRRTPQAKWDLTPAKLDTYLDAQRTVLSAAAPLVEDGGALVYATCSVLRCENDAQSAWFAEAFPEFEQLDACQLLPGHPGDGFYYAAFRKCATTEG